VRKNFNNYVFPEDVLIFDPAEESYLKVTFSTGSLAALKRNLYCMEEEEFA
jgi:hypothetical protein